MIKLGTKQVDIDVHRVILLLQEELLKKYDSLYFKDIKVTGNDIMVTCPLHGNHNESHPSMGINVNTGLFHCFTCGEAGSIDLFVSKCLQHNDNGEYGRKWLINLFSDSIYDNRAGIQIQERKHYIPKNYVTEEELDKYRWYHPYMWKRRLTPEIVERYDIGFDKETSCITFPVNDLTGNCVFLARRSVKTKFFHYPKDVQKPVYGLDKCINAKTIYICESIFNALTIVSYGLNACALLGTGSREQYEILSKCSVRKFYLCFDGDSAGRRGAERFIKNVKTKAKIVVVDMIEGKDVNDISKEQFFRLVTKADKKYIDSI